MRKLLGNLFWLYSICATMTLMAVALHHLGWMDNMENSSMDTRARISYWLRQKTGGVQVSPHIVLAGVDQKTIDPKISRHADRPGSGVWVTRDIWVRALPWLNHTFKPRVVAYDYIFSPYRSNNRGDKPSDVQVDEFLRRHPKSIKQSVLENDFPRLELLDLLDQAGSTHFGNQLSDARDLREQDPSVPVYIASYTLNSSREEHGVKPWNLQSKDDEEKLEILENFSLPTSCIQNPEAYPPLYDNVSLPFDEIVAYARLGCINVPRDPDGSVRRIPLLYGFQHPTSHQWLFLPSLTLQTCLAWHQIQPGDDASLKDKLRIVLGEKIHLQTPDGPLEIPIDERGNLLLNFHGKIPDFQEIPYISILDYGPHLQNSANGGPVSTEVLQKAQEIHSRTHGKIMIIGQTYTGAGDVGPCPVDNHVPLVFIHMTAIDNILRNSFMHPPLKKWVVDVIFIALSFFLFLQNAFSKRTGASWGTLLLLGAWTLSSIILFHFLRLGIPLVIPSLMILWIFAGVTFYRFQVEQKARIEIRKHFSTLVSPRVLSLIEEKPEILTKGERTEVTVFFSDVAKFTSISEKLPPDELSRVLNDYLTPMTDLILQRDGYLNKYAGDGIMAVWGVPYASGDHALQACLSALEQQERLKILQREFLEKYQIKLHVRMGLNSGIVSAGMMGSRAKKEYTVMGDTVNFAARLEPTNKDYHTLILIGDHTRKLAGDTVICRMLDRIVVEGKTEPVLIHELVGTRPQTTPEQIQFIETFEKGLQDFWARQWDSAIQTFHNLLLKNPEDSPSQIFLERAREFKIHPPPPNWKGEHVRQGKN